jgi:hypothetical protein
MQNHTLMMSCHSHGKDFAASVLAWSLSVVLLVALVGAQPARAESLADMLVSAYQFSPKLKQQRSVLDSTNEQRATALSGWLPTITVSPSVNASQTGEPRVLSYNQRYRTYGNTASISQPITSGGGEYARLQNADHTILAARAALLAAEQTVLYTATTAYLDVLTVRRILRAQEEDLVDLRQIRDIVRRQVSVGDRTAPEETLAAVRVASAEATLIDTRAQVKMAEARYAAAAGHPAPKELADPVPLTVLPPTLDDARKLAKSENPTVKASVFTALAARDAVDQAIAALLPSLSISISDTRDYRYYAKSQKSLNGQYPVTSLTLQMSVPIFQGGSEYAAVRSAKKTARADGYARESAEVNAIANVEQSWYQRESLADQLMKYRDQLNLSKELVSAYRRQVAAGQITILEALDGFSSQLQAKVLLISVERGKALADYGLLQDVGGLTARTLELNTSYYDPIGDYSMTKWRIWGLGIE